MRAVVVLPIDEVGHPTEVLTALRSSAPGVDVLVVDDHRDGFRRAVAEGYDTVITMADDLSHDPGVISTLLGRIAEGADAVIGSRYVRGGGTNGWPWWRRWLSRWGNASTRALLGLDVHDCTSGFRGYRAAALVALDADSTTTDGYALQIELVRGLHRLQMDVVEVPVVCGDLASRTPVSSMRMIGGSTLRVTEWALRDRAEQVRAAFGRS